MAPYADNSAPGYGFPKRASGTVTWRLFVPALLLLLACRGVAADPTPSERVQELIEQGKLNDALSITNDELRKDSSSVIYRFLKGSILTRMNKLDDAAAIFQQLTVEHPELPEPYNNLAVVYAASGDFEKARQALQKAINTHPSYATAHENLGDIYAKMASQAYNHALQLDEGNSTAKAKLALINDLFSLSGKVPVVATQAPPPATGIPASANAPSAEAAVETSKTAAGGPAPETGSGKTAGSGVSVPAMAAASPPAPEKAAQSVQNPPAAPATPPGGGEASVPLPAVKSPAASTAGGADTAGVKRAVEAWRSAWSARDVKAYLASYADDFTPEDGQLRDAWVAERLDRLTGPRFIRVKIANLEIGMLGDDHAQASFTQTYQSDSYNDQVRKLLLFKKQADKWVITQESVK